VHGTTFTRDAKLMATYGDAGVFIRTVQSGVVVLEIVAPGFKLGVRPHSVHAPLLESKKAGRSTGDLQDHHVTLACFAGLL
jgi:hypothetical protein